MLLGTYQPLFRAGCHPGLKESAYRIVEQVNGSVPVPFDSFGDGWDAPTCEGDMARIGFDPAFCFPCRTPEEAFVQSCLASPNSSDLFFLVEADEYVKIDRAAWEGHVRSGTSYPERLAECIAPDLDDDVCDFLIPVGKLKDFKVACVAMPAYASAYAARMGLWLTRPSGDIWIDFDAVERSLPGFRDRLARADAEVSRLRKGRLSAPECAAYDEAEAERLLETKYCKNLFECSVLPAIASAALSGSDRIEAADFFRVAMGVGKLPRAMARLAEWAEGSRDRDGYRAAMEGIREAWCGSKDVLAAWFNGGPWPGRNEPCLCGSGKKFKKCCGARYGL